MDGLPTAVKKQDAEADAALAALAEARLGDDHSESAAETTANTQDTLAEATPELTSAPEQKVEAPADVEAQKKQEETDNKEELRKLRASLEVLQGKYNSEVPRFTARIKELEAQNDALKDDLDQEKASKTPELTSEMIRKYLTEDEAEGLDEDVLDFQSRLARGVSEAVTDQKAKRLEQKVDALQELLDNVSSSQSAAQDAIFWAEAEKLAPGITAANDSNAEDWVEFLDQVEPLSRLPYRALGVAAIERGDSTAVANLFLQMKGNSGGEPAAKRTPVEAQLKPETSPSATRTDRPQGPRIKESEIARFYNSAAGKLTPDQIAAQEAIFDKAASEGRIDFGK